MLKLRFKLVATNSHNLFSNFAVHQDCSDSSHEICMEEIKKLNILVRYMFLWYRGQQTYFVKGQIVASLGFVGLSSLLGNCSSVLLEYKSSQRQYENDWKCLCSNKTLWILKFEFQIIFLYYEIFCFYIFSTI